MWSVPTSVVLTAGSGSGATPLTAFHSALLDAGIGRFNLARVTSIVPPYAEVVCDGGLDHRLLSDMEAGTLLPVVYSAITSDADNQTVSAAVAVGYPKERSLHGVIFERSLVGTKAEAITSATLMVHEVMRDRQVEAFELRVTSSVATAIEGVVCAVAAAVLLR